MRGPTSQLLVGTEQTPTFDLLLKDSEVEIILNVHDGFLAKDRVGKARLPFVRIGRSVRYRKSDVVAFIAKNLRQSTSDVGAGK